MEILGSFNLTSSNVSFGVVDSFVNVLNVGPPDVENQASLLYFTSSNSSTISADSIVADKWLGAAAFSTQAKSVTSSYPIVEFNDFAIYADATSGAFNVTLPNSTPVLGEIYMIKKVDSSVNAVTVVCYSGQTIDGQSSFILGSQYKFVMLQSFNNNWQIISHN